MAYEDFRGNIAAVYRARSAVVAGKTTAAGVPIAEHLLAGWRDAELVGQSGLYAAFRREMTQGEQAYWRHGEKARRDHRVYGRRAVPHRNAVWQTDHTQMEIVVIPPRGKALRPWLTTFVDHATRAIMGWAISKNRDAGVVLCALRSALLCDPDAGGHGGVPAVIECDHGKEFTSGALKRTTATLGIEMRPVEPYEGRGKGVIERWHQTIEEMFTCQLPGYTGGPRDKRGRLYGPVGDDAAWRENLPEPVEGQTPAALPIEALARLFNGWACWFNSEHEHQGIGGRTPLQAWKDDRTPITVIDAERLRDLLLVVEDATVTASGLRHRNLHYWAPELNGRVGQKVEFRYAPHDDRFLEVYLDGTHVTTARPSDAASPEEAQVHRQAWQEESKQLKVRRQRASARSRDRIAPLTGSNDGGDELGAQTRLVPRSAPRPASSSRGSTSLLGLREPGVVTPGQRHEQRATAEER